MHIKTNASRFFCTPKRSVLRITWKHLQFEKQTVDPVGRIYAELLALYAQKFRTSMIRISSPRPRIVVGGDNREQSKRARSPRPLFIVMRRDVDHGHV